MDSLTFWTLMNQSDSRRFTGCKIGTNEETAYP
jgi:hypothetical protein